MCGLSFCLSVASCVAACVCIVCLSRGAPDAALACAQAWTDSTACDTQFVDEDVWGSTAHVSMLGYQGVIPAGDAAKILTELGKTQDEFHAGTWKLAPEREDVHMNVEGRLIGAPPPPPPRARGEGDRG